MRASIETSPPNSMLIYVSHCRFRQTAHFGNDGPARVRRVRVAASTLRQRVGGDSAGRVSSQSPHHTDGARCEGDRHREMPRWRLVDAVLGEDAEPSFGGVVSSEPGSPAQYWHTDSPHEAPEHRVACGLLFVPQKRLFREHTL
jgi:hypothetical protein